MSIAEKQLLVDNVLTNMASELTGTQLIALRQCLSDQMESFTIEQAKTEYNESEDYLGAFISAKQIEGRSPKTIERYEYIIMKLMSAVGVPTKHISVYHLRNYLADMKERGLADRTLEGMRSVFSSYFGWLQKEGLITKNPCANLGPIKYMKKVRLPFSDVELHKIKEQCRSKRDIAIVHFLLSTGCRISEVCSLNRDRIDFDKKECVVLGKGNKERTVYIDNVTALILQRYLDDRKDKSEALFAGKGTDRLKPGGVRKLLNGIGDRAGVENVHPHRFRRTLATNLINRGMTIQEVANILGHENINTTMTYVFVDQANVHNSYERYT